MNRQEISKKPTKKELGKALQVLQEGGIVVYPTDTVYGLAVDAFNIQAIGKLFVLKRRVQKPLPIIAHNMVKVKEIAEVNKKQEALMKKYWPGAITFVVTKKDVVPNALTLGLTTIGIRIPASPVPVMLAEMLGRPITSTSANISGDSVGSTIDEISRQFRTVDQEPDYYLDAGELDEQEPSTVVDISKEIASILRKGPVSFTHIK